MTALGRRAWPFQLRMRVTMATVAKRLFFMIHNSCAPDIIGRGANNISP